MNIRVGVSNRHVHLLESDYEILFGKNSHLTKRNDLSQDDEFASNDVVTIKTEAGTLNNVRVLGPFRNYTQVEVSKTDTYTLKINPAYASSGHFEDASVVTIIGPKGKVTKKCCILAVRHIHVNNIDDTYHDGQKVSVIVNTIKGGIMDNVYIKKGKGYHFELHLDTDDANAFDLKNGDYVRIIDEEV